MSSASLKSSKSDFLKYASFFAFLAQSWRNKSIAFVSKSLIVALLQISEEKSICPSAIIFVTVQPSPPIFRSNSILLHD